MTEMVEYTNAIQFLTDNGADDISFKQLEGETMVIYPPIANNDKTQEYLDSIAVPGSTGMIVHCVAINALDNFNKSKAD